MKKNLALTLSLVILFYTVCGCSAPAKDNTSPTIQSDSTTPSSVPNFTQSNDEMFTNRDLKSDYDEADSISIRFHGDTVTCDSDCVQISGSTVRITNEGTYVLSGTLNDGTVIVDAKDSAKLQLVLDGANISCSTSAALYILQADKVFVTLAPETENSLSNGGSFTAIDENNIDSPLFSKQDLTLNGTGKLTVTSPVGHGIVCKDDLVFAGGSYNIASASHGLDVNDSVRITDASITIDAGKDGIHVENTDDAELGFVYASGGTVAIESEGDGISTGAYIQIEGGIFDLLTGGGSENGTKSSSDSWGGFMDGGFMGGDRPAPQPNAVSTTTDDSSTSMKGLKAVGDILISGGDFAINSADDSIHSTKVTINGGNFEIASGDDAVHADEALTVTDCTMNITESYEGLEALNIAVSGGDITLVATDDGLNAAGGNDSSGINGGRDPMFEGGRGQRPDGGKRPRPGGDPFGGDMGGASNGSITISGGKLNITASGDGIDANGTLTISGGHTVVCGPTQGDTATLDYDVSGIITGGTFIGTGARGMAQSFSDSQQGVYTVSVGNQSAGTPITLTDKDGNVVISHTPDLPFGLIILSSPDIIKGQPYTITVGTESGEFEAT